MSQVRQLYRLQQTDSEISAKKLRLAEVVHLQRETRELRAARARDKRLVKIFRPGRLAKVT